MTVLAWDEAGERRYETGIDRGVLYVPDGAAVPWNGLVAVTEERTRELKSHYIDGIKYLDRILPGAYSAKLQAFTYPDELDELTGTSEFAPGVNLHDQRGKAFHLSYRTKIGNDLDADHGYKIHVVYNIVANPSDFSAQTLSQSVQVSPFEWQLTGTPSNMFGIRPTAHISLDSTKIDADALVILEGLLYGDEVSDPELPGLVDLLGLIEAL